MDPPQQPQQPPVLRRRSTQHAQWRPGSRAVAHKAEEHYLRDDVRLPVAGPALANFTGVDVAGSLYPLDSILFQWKPTGDDVTAAKVVLDFSGVPIS